MPRIGDWVETASGIKFYPLDPRPEDVHIWDIAHALSLLCRFGGHCKHFYSVAQHSLNVVEQMRRDEVLPEGQLYGLLHDAAEAYVCDVPRPLKPSLVGYQRIEGRVQGVIWDALGLPEPGEGRRRMVKMYDDLVLAAEAQVLMRCTDGWNLPVDERVKVDCRQVNPLRVMERFLDEYMRLRVDGLQLRSEAE